MAKRPRCRDCGHRRGPRAVTATRKTAGKDDVEPRVHKRPCSCTCHQRGERS